MDCPAAFIVVLVALGVLGFHRSRQHLPMVQTCIETYQQNSSSPINENDNREKLKQIKNGYNAIIRAKSSLIQQRFLNGIKNAKVHENILPCFLFFSVMLAIQPLISWKMSL